MAWVSSELDGWVPKMSVPRKTVSQVKLYPFHNPAWDHFCILLISQRNHKCLPTLKGRKKTTDPPLVGVEQCAIVTKSGMGYLWSDHFGKILSATPSFTKIER